jgi:long-chain acyl-CoA synthetase
VCILLPNGIDFVVSFFAVAAARGIAIPMDPALTTQELRRYLDGLKLAAVICESYLQIQLPTDCIVIRVDITDALQPPPFDTSYDGPVLCQFSSGSTGLPKRVIRSQYHLLQEYKQLSAAIRVHEDDAVAVIVPLHHAHGFGNAMLLALCNGIRLVIPKPSRGDDGRELPLRFWRKDFLALLAAERVTILPAVPFVFGLLAEVQNLPEVLCLRYCISAGSPIDEDTYRRFYKRFGTHVRQLYGCTEAGSVTINADEDADQNWQSVGKPLPGVELRLEGEDNIVAIRSAAMPIGYHGQHLSDNDAFRDGWFRPGDVGQFDEHGNLYIIGRHRPFIVCGGFKVDPAEVEQVLRMHPDVAEAIVFGIPHPAVGELIKAVVVPRAGAPLDKNELIELCCTQLGSYKQPRLLEIRDSLPRSPLGKILIKELI